MASSSRNGLTLFALLVLLGILSPALFTLVHGEKDPSPAGTPDPELKPETIALSTDDNVVAREEEQMSAEGFSVKEQKILKESAETHAFEAEVDKLMHIIINSLYSNREVFLRELISNASDALDKIRFLSLTNSAELETGNKLEIRIKIDKENKILQITDTGVGMTKEELIKNLGTIAKSGTMEFLKKFSGTGDTNLIGQFGVGFYSAFLAADTVTVVSKNNKDKQYVWRSDASGSFSVVEDPRGDTLGRGTSISLHIKEDAEEFLSEDKIKGLVKKYSEFINFPIYLWASHEEEREVPLTEEEIKEQESKEEEESEEVSMDGETEEKKEEAPKTKKVTEKVYDWELMNDTKPIWTRSPKEVTEEEYNNFYKSFSKDYADPLAKSHFVAEGEVDFKSLLYVPSTPPPNLFDPNSEAQKGIKLYVKRVFITDDFKDLLPKYLLFLRGVVDSEDLPLNVSREMLQEHKILGIIKKKLVRKAIALFQSLQEDEDKEKWQTFWQNYGSNIKLGVIEDAPNRTRLSKLLMFWSSKTGELTSLDDYVSRMKDGQTQIYYLAGESKEVVEGSPLLERLVKKGYEVLYMVDPIDEYALANLEKYDGKFKLTNIAREGLELDNEKVDKEKEQQIKEEFSSLTSFLKSTLGSKIEKVNLSNRLTTSPAALVSSAYGWTANMERIIKAQALADPKASQFYTPKRVLEINPRHPIIKELNSRVKADTQDPVAKEIAELLYETSALTSGFSLEDPAELANRINRVISTNLGINPDEVVEDEPESEPELEPKEPETRDAETHDEL